jgi:hypothetical protein
VGQILARQESLARLGTQQGLDTVRILQTTNYSVSTPGEIRARSTSQEDAVAEQPLGELLHIGNFGAE